MPMRPDPLSTKSETGEDELKKKADSSFDRVPQVCHEMEEVIPAGNFK